MSFAEMLKLLKKKKKPDAPALPRSSIPVVEDTVEDRLRVRLGEGGPRVMREVEAAAAAECPALTAPCIAILLLVRSNLPHESIWRCATTGHLFAFTFISS